MPEIQYSEKYFDDKYEYRHVVLPRDIAKLLPKNVLLTEESRISKIMFPNGALLNLCMRVEEINKAEWRGIGVQQSRGWVHYAIHKPEPHIMLFRRPLNYEEHHK